MQYQYIPYIWPLIASAIASLSLGIYALLRRRNAKGAIGFIISMAVLTLWSLANALEMSGADFSTKLFWANVQYFAYCYSPVTLLILCMEFTGYDRWIKSGRILWVAVIPTIIILLVWTDGLHGLIRYDMHMDYSASFPVISKKYGPVFFIHALYSQFLNIFAWVLLIKAVFSRNAVYRKQALSLFLGLNLIIIPNILYILGLSPVKRLDITPLFFGPAGLIAAWGIFRFKLFDVIPMAWATVIKTMDAGVMVLDLHDRVLDINPAFRKIVGYTDSMVPAMQVKEVCGKIPELVSVLKDRTAAHREFSISTGGLLKVYEVIISPLTDDKGMLIGRLAVVYDITKKKQEQQEYIEQQWKHAVTMERERYARDLHDNLGQVLGFINLQAQGIRQELANAGIEMVSHQLDKLVDVAQSANNEIREYICSVRNEDAAEWDFAAVLTRFILNFEKQTGINVKLDLATGLPRDELSPNIKINILNIIKEALNNIRKHAKACNASVAFYIAQAQLCVTIEDDGKGFDIGQKRKDTRSGFGLSIMRERASEIGAQIYIKSAHGKGSRIALYIPWKENENVEENHAGR